MNSRWRPDYYPAGHFENELPVFGRNMNEIARREFALVGSALLWAQALAK
jgi:hypothetical protein